MVGGWGEWGRSNSLRAPETGRYTANTETHASLVIWVYVKILKKKPVSAVQTHQLRKKNLVR